MFTSAKEVIGIEKNKYFADITQEVIDKFAMKDRASIINDDILNQAAVLKRAHIIVMNNVFEWFSTKEELDAIWQFLRTTITRKNTLIVSSPDLSKAVSVCFPSPLTLSPAAPSRVG